MGCVALTRARARRLERVRYLTVQQGATVVGRVSLREKGAGRGSSAVVPEQAQRQVQPTKEDLAASFDAAAGDGLGQGDHAEVRVQVRDGLPAILSANSANV